MAVLSNKISFLILLKFILLNKVFSQSLTVEPPRPNNDDYSVQNELTRNLKKRLGDFGSLGRSEQKQEPTPEPKTEDSFLETRPRARQVETNIHSARTATRTHTGPYQPRPKEDLQYANFEDFLSKQNKEFLQRCTNNPHEFVLVVDESGSISSYNWGTVMRDSVNLVTSAIAQLNGDNKLSIVQYSHKPKMAMEPRTLNKSSLLSALNVIKHMFEAKRTYGTTYTGAALEFVRDQVLDPKDKFLVELSEGASPLNKKNMIVILMTDGASKDPERALKESLIQRYNGVDLFVFGIGSVNEEECRKLVGCPPTGECNNFLHAQWNTVLDYLYKLISSICKDTGRNATCVEKWSEFGECSVPCGGGVRTSRLLKVTTVAEATTGLDGVKGLTCEEQYKNVTEKTERCNMFPCRDNLVNINEHTPEDKKPVPKRLMTMVYGKQKEPDDTLRSGSEPLLKPSTHTTLGEAGRGGYVYQIPERLEREPLLGPEDEETEETEEETETEPETKEEKEPEEERVPEQQPVREPVLEPVQAPVTVPPSEPKKPDLTEDTSRLSDELKKLENEESADQDLTQNAVTTEPEVTEREDQDLTQNTVTTESEVKERTMPRLETAHTYHRPKDPVDRLTTESHVGDALRQLVDQGPEVGRAPFHILGGPEHENLKVGHVLDDREVEDMERGKREQTHKTEELTEPEPLLQPTKLTETRSERHHVHRLSDRETQTPKEEPKTTEEKSTETEKETKTTEEKSTETQQEPEPVQRTESSTQTKHHETVQRHTPTTNVTHEHKHHTRHTPEHTTPSLQNVEALTKSFKQRFKEFLHNEKVKKLSAVAIVIFLTAISISVFSYIFLRDKEPTPHLFDPSDQEFMNAGDGDDVEPSENYQVSNMEDGIWA